MSKKTKTPCIGVCSTGIGDSVCRGCKRFAHEVIGWNGYSEDERRAILRRIEALTKQVMQERVLVVDKQQLVSQLEQNRVRVNPGMSEYCLAYEAIRVFGSQLKDLGWIGCQARGHWQQADVAEIKRSVEENLFELSRAHYERYFPGHL